MLKFVFFNLSLIMLTTAVVFGMGHKSVGEADTAFASEAVTAAVGPNCRYGVADTFAQTGVVSNLGAGWALNFTTSFINYPNRARFAPIIRLQQNKDAQGRRLPSYHISGPQLNDNPGQLGALVAAHPGIVWIVGNEVDRVVWQDDLEPAMYAVAYHDIYQFIKQRDPTARVAISGLVQVTPGRLQYLDLVWSNYLKKYGEPMPVDVWNMHLYILPERNFDGSPSFASIAIGTDPNLGIYFSGSNPATCGRDDVYCYAEHDNMDIFKKQIIDMRKWMKAHGEQDKPLIISEYSLLYTYRSQGPQSDTNYTLLDEYGNSFNPTRVSQFMQNTFNYLETAADPGLGYPADNNRLVQQWLWYAINDGSPATPNKLAEQGSNNLTMMGNTYKSWVASQPLTVNTLVEETYAMPAFTSGGTANTTITAVIRNNGNSRTAQPITVSFHDAAANLIGSATIPAGFGGCAVDERVITVPWNGLASGRHDYTVTISGGEDSNVIDNISAGSALIDPKQIHIPLVNR